MTFTASRDIFIPPSVTRTPSEEEMNTTKTVRGRTISTLMDGTNSLLGYKFLRSQVINFEVNGDDDASPEVTEYHLRFKVSPLAQYLWVGFWYFATNDKTYGPDGSISFELEDYSTGTSLDVLTWNVTNGLILLDNGATEGATSFNESFADTGWSTNGSSSQPKLLDISDYKGKELEAIFYPSTSPDVRIYSAILHEVYYDTI